MGLPTINKRLVPNFTQMYHRKKGMCLHHACAFSLNSVYNTFMNREASTMWGVAPNAIDQYLEYGVYEWACGDSWANTYLESVEVINSGGAPDWDVAEESFDTLIELMVWRFQQHPEWGLARWGINVFEHKMFYPTSCAGQVGWRGEEICRRVNERLEGVIPVEDKKWTGVRLAGDNRYGTNSAVVRWANANWDALKAERPWETVIIYRDTVDAFGLANIPGDHPGIMVNANPESNGGEKSLLAEHKGEIKRFIALGGVSVLPDAVLNRLAVAAGI